MTTYKIEIVRTNTWGEIASDARAFRTYEIEASSEHEALRLADRRASSEKGMPIHFAPRIAR